MNEEKAVCCSVSKDILAEVFPNEDPSACEIIVEEYLSNSSSELSENRNYSFIEIPFLGELIVPIICALVVETVKEIYRKQITMKDFDIQQKAYIASLEAGLKPEEAKKISHEFVKSFKKHLLIR